MIDQLIGALVITVLSSLMGTSLVAPTTADVPGDTDLLQVGGAAYWTLPSLFADPLGVSLYPDAVPQRIDYPATPIGFIDQAVRVGAEEVDLAIKDAAADGSEVVVVGHSEGSMVVDHLQAGYRTDPNAPPADKVTFIIYGSPERGLLHLLFQDGTFVPGFGLTTKTPIESQYDTIVVTGEYDLASDPPDRPWNLLALANAAVGFATVHHTYAFVDPDTIPAENTTTVINSQGAKITTQLIPSEHLPLTAPIRIVAPELADRVDEVLRPVIDSAYVRHNAEDPYLSEGKLVDPDGPVVKSESVTIAADPAAMAGATKREPTVTAATQKHKPARDALKRVTDRVKNAGTGEHVKKPKSLKKSVKDRIKAKEHKDS